MSKAPCSFRLPKETVAVLNELQQKTGFNKGQLLEQSVILLRRAYGDNHLFIEKVIEHTKEGVIHPAKSITTGEKQ